MTSMLAVRAHRGVDGLVLEDIPIPEPGPHDVVIKVAAAGLAPGLLRLLELGFFKHLPTTIGHQAAGTIAAVGNDVTGVGIGDRVRVHGLLTCRDCSYCRTDHEMMCPEYAILGHAAFGRGPLPLYDEYHNGGLAEYVRVPHWLVDRLPDSVSFDVAAKVHEIANALRALKLANVSIGSTVVVTATTGAMGAATVKLAEHFGIARLVLVGRDTERLAGVARLARVPTATLTLGELPEDWATTGGLTRRVRELAPEGVAAVIDFIPDGPGTGQAMAALSYGGTLVHMGGNQSPLSLSPFAIMTNCWRFVGARAFTRNDAQEVLRLLATGVLNADELITHRFPLTDALKAADAIQRRDEPMWMTVVNP
jgi:threonine dehydrogenase-like Zn-dependent dehydrogenase